MTQLHFLSLTKDLLSTTYPLGRLKKWKDVIDTAKRSKIVVAVCDDEEIIGQMKDYFIEIVGKENLMFNGKLELFVRQGWGGVIITSSHPSKDVLGYNPAFTYYYIYEEKSNGQAA